MQQRNGLHPMVAGFFSAKTPAEQEMLQSLQHFREVDDGEVLFAAGDPADTLALVIKGRFAVHKPIGITGRSQVVALLEPGTVIGEGALIEGRQRGSTVVAVASSTVIVLGHGALTEIENTMPHLYLALVKKVLAITSLRLRKSSDRLALVL